MSKANNPLSVEFLYELYATAMRSELVCSVLTQHMQREFLPDKAFQRVQELFCSHYRNYKKAPNYAILSQSLSGDLDGMELVNTFAEYDGDSTGDCLDMLRDISKVYDFNRYIRRSASSTTNLNKIKRRIY